ncbi:hypothetical protein TYRP_012623 [Tyrophagus putrescentiae]|nr:hypothetical protein TYRP_012623 [Tyrophagus putrescentiae]
MASLHRQGAQFHHLISIFKITTATISCLYTFARTHFEVDKDKQQQVEGEKEEKDVLVDEHGDHRKEEDIGENDGNGGKVEPRLRLEAHTQGEQQQTEAGGQAAGQQERPRGEAPDQGDGHQGHGRVEGRTADAAVLGGQVGEAHRAEGLRGVVEDGVDAGQLLAGVQGADHRKGRSEAATIFQDGENRQLVSIATLATLRLQAHGGHLVQQLQDGALSAQGEES